ncbi:MAG: hypothetical protein R2771_15460 [Saprospiraceae bacterium]
MYEEFDEIKSLIDSKILPDNQKNDFRDQLIEEVSKRVEYLMDTNMELFLNHLYRMDVDEKKVMEILNNENHKDENHNISVYALLAELIVARQEKRMETKRKFKQSDWIEI